MRRKIILTGSIITGILLFSRCLESGRHDPRGTIYAGSASCVSCHRQIVDSYGHTPHYHSAAIATPAAIEGSFSKDSNTFHCKAARLQSHYAGKNGKEYLTRLFMSTVRKRGRSVSISCSAMQKGRPIYIGKMNRYSSSPFPGSPVCTGGRAARDTRQVCLFLTDPCSNGVSNVTLRTSLHPTLKTYMHLAKSRRS